MSYMKSMIQQSAKAQVAQAAEVEAKAQANAGLASQLYQQDLACLAEEKHLKQEEEKQELQPGTLVNQFFWSHLSSKGQMEAIHGNLGCFAARSAQSPRVKEMLMLKHEMDGSPEQLGLALRASESSDQGWMDLYEESIDLMDEQDEHLLHVMESAGFDPEDYQDEGQALMIQKAKEIKQVASLDAFISSMVSLQVA